MTDTCVFCKIANGTIPAKIVYSDDEVVCIEDVNPVAPLHYLLITREHVVSTLDLQVGHDRLIGRLFRICAQLAREHGVAEDGFRIVTNTNGAAGQSVFHIHFHLLAGRQLSWPPG
jgi:histidine triad (HIT) family protein